jgi:hypothetical protein
LTKSAFTLTKLAMPHFMTNLKLSLARRSR